jgi:ubiquinone/menaquinone biosynthesis C-methylase UbiE
MKLGRDFDAYQDFILGCKVYWTTELFGELRNTYDQKVRRLPEPPSTAAQVDELFEGDTLYGYYAWLERHLQRMKYSGRHGVAPALETHRDTLEAQLNQPLPAGMLHLDENLQLPRYFTSVDIHQHPGGVWNDSLAGLVYERGARTTTPMLNKHRDLHFRFTKLVESYKRPRRLVDLGCGFGKSTQAFYSEYHDAEVVGVDIAAPCLRLAAVNASEHQAQNVEFRQARAEETGLEAEAFDVATSTMMIHEMPPPAVQGMIAETYRLLEPGGVAIHLDFLADDDAFDRFIHYGHARRNNEPYMPALNEMDLVQAHRDAGFSDVKVIPFEERPGTLAAEFEAWRFPWAVVVARK